MKNLNPLKKLNVLFVDDEKTAREKLSAILKYYFNEVYLASDGVEALTVFQNTRCHLLLVDYDMPVMNGNDLIAKIRTFDSKTPAVMISSYDDKEKLKNAIKLNLVDYLVKPYEMSHLKEVFSESLEWMERYATINFYFNENLYYSYVDKSISKNSKQVALTAYEVTVLELLIANKNCLVSYAVLFDAFEMETTQKSLFTIIYKLKKKLCIDVIKNIKDMGYILNCS